MKVFFKRLKHLRQKEGLTQQQIADLVHVNRVTYTNWESGAREPNFQTLLKLADFFEVSLDWLFGRKVELGEEE